MRAPGGVCFGLYKSNTGILYGYASFFQCGAGLKKRQATEGCGWLLLQEEAGSWSTRYASEIRLLKRLTRADNSHIKC